MPPKIAIWATTVGQVEFAEVLVGSLRRNTHLAYEFCWMMDTASTKDEYKFHAWRHEQHPEAEFMGTSGAKGSVNYLWRECIKLSAQTHDDICVVLNDDVYLLPGWLDAIVEVFDRNPQVAVVGLPCFDKRFKPLLEPKSRWFDDPLVFKSLNLSEFLDEPAKYEPWVSGFCWACRPQIWLEHAAVDDRLFWAHGEMDMGLKMWKAGYHVVSVYWPQVYHYGGGAYTVTSHGEKPGRDAEFFTELYGTSECNDLLADWKAEKRELPEINYSPLVRVNYTMSDRIERPVCWNVSPIAELADLDYESGACDFPAGSVDFIHIDPHFLAWLHRKGGKREVELFWRKRASECIWGSAS